MGVGVGGGCFSCPPVFLWAPQHVILELLRRESSKHVVEDVEVFLPRGLAYHSGFLQQILRDVGWNVLGQCQVSDCTMCYVGFRPIIL